MLNLNKEDFLAILDTYEATLDACREKGEFLNRYDRGRLMMSLIENWLHTLGQRNSSWGEPTDDE